MRLPLAWLLQDVDRLNQAKYANQQYDYLGQMGTAEMQNRNAFLTGILGDRMGAANAQDAESMARIGSAQDAQAQQQLDVNYGNYWDQTQSLPLAAVELVVVCPRARHECCGSRDTAAVRWTCSEPSAALSWAHRLEAACTTGGRA